MAPRDKLEMRDLPSPAKVKKDPEHNLDVMAALLGKKQESKKKIKTRQMKSIDDTPIDPRLKNSGQIEKSVHDAKPVSVAQKQPLVVVRPSDMLEVYQDKGQFKNLMIKQFLDQYMPSSKDTFKVFRTIDELETKVVKQLNWLHFG